MFGRKMKTALASAALCGLAAPAMAGSTTNSQQDLQQQIAALQKQVAQLKQNQDKNQSWLDQRKKAEVKNLVQDVMSDASSRSSMLQEGQTAGISDDGKIFLRSADGSFSFNPYGLVQVQYIYNNLPNGATGGDETPGGFQTGDLRFGANGHIGNPHIGYHFELSAVNNLFTSIGIGDVVFDEYTVFYKFDNGLKITAGRFKQPFSKSTLLNDGHQLTVDRSITEGLFSAGRSQGAMVSYKTNKWLLRAAVNNGGDKLHSIAGFGGNPSNYGNYRSAPVDFAVTARADYKVAGDWDQSNDPFNSWSGTGEALFLGAGVDYEVGRTPSGITGSNIGHLIKYTADASYQNKGLSVYLAGFGEHVNFNDGSSNQDNFGAIAQAGYFVVPDKVQPFVRYSGIFSDNAAVGGGSTVNTLAAGLNWYQHRQNAKFTIDGVYVFNKFGGFEALTNTLSNTTKQGEIAIRAQYQLMF